jgi:hypothetical protein
LRARSLLQMTWSDRDNVWAAFKAAASGDMTVPQPNPENHQKKKILYLALREGKRITIRP